MAQFTVNAQRFDPYKNFKFRVKWDGRYVAGVSKVSALKRTTEVVKHREGGDPAAAASRPDDRIRRDHPGARRDPRYGVRDSGRTRCGTTGRPGAEVSLKDFRKDITIEFYNEAGQLAIRPTRCIAAGCPSIRPCPNSTPTPTPSRSSTIKLENEGWERDLEVNEPAET